jgi:DNA-binding response OmpR family regulator
VVRSLYRPPDLRPPDPFARLNYLHPQSGGRARVLVIEDDQQQLNGLSMALKAAGYTVFGAGDAAYGTAIALLKPDLILLDIGLPDSDGYAVAQCIRDDPETAGMPILFLSARSAPEDIARAEHLGAAAYLVKPCRAQTVIEAITKTLTGKSARSPMQTVNPARQTS